MKKILLSLSIASLLILACNTSKKTTVIDTSSGEVSESTITPSKVTWAFNENTNINFESILAKAKAEKKLIFIDAYATWCGPCKIMDRNVFTDSPTADFFNKNFISYKVNIEKGNGSTIQLLYEVNSLPSLIFTDVEGKVLEKAENSVTISQLKAMAERALAKKGK